MAPEIRNNTRVMVDDPGRAEALWARIARFVPPRLGDADVAGLNERLRFYRYDPGQRFAWHRDGAFERNGRERSKLRLMVYLNEGFDGGDTEFDVGERIAVRPETGMVLLFSHPVRHQGSSVTRGRKYVLRTDVMYRAGAPDEARGVRAEVAEAPPTSRCSDRSGPPHTLGRQSTRIGSVTDELDDLGPTFLRRWLKTGAK
jgi:prolyl 4-hydroxylase